MGRTARRVRDGLILARDCVPMHRTGRRIITLHDVPDAAGFYRRMDWLRRNYTIVPLRELLTRTGDARQVALTFDDGYASWHEVALPVLRELGLPATFFVCSGYVGLERDTADQFARRHLRRTQMLTPLSREQLRRLAEVATFEIGSHTVHHVDLRSLKEPELEMEIAAGRSQLEDLTGRQVSLFAYPFGESSHATPSAKTALKKAGFEWAFTIVPTFVERAYDRFSIGRDSLDVRDSERLWAGWLRGSYDTLYRIRHFS